VLKLIGSTNRIIVVAMIMQQAFGVGVMGVSDDHLVTMTTCGILRMRSSAKVCRMRVRQTVRAHVSPVWACAF